MPSTTRGARAAPGGRWRFWIDRGGTFTDVVGVDGGGRLHVAKLLSERPGKAGDAVVAGVRGLLGLADGEPVPRKKIAAVRVGTTVATNALLEGRGAKVALVTTRGFRDALLIRDQARPDLFDLFPRRRRPLYDRVIEVDERVRADGTIERGPDLVTLKPRLAAALKAGVRSVAVVCMHGYRHSRHERMVADLCLRMGFGWVFASCDGEAVTGLVRRGETTVADAYLTPLLRRYVDTVSAKLGGVPLQFMQSSGGLAGADAFFGRNAVLSGPAGGVVGAIGAARLAGAKRLVSFDMGGTSTDVAHFAGQLERTDDTQVAGTRIAARMLRLHTVAAGGGSVCRVAAGRMQVGPASAGAVPGPACYGLGGPLTVTDCNLVLGRLVPESLPRTFGKNRDRCIDVAAARKRLAELARKMGRGKEGLEQVAREFVDVAVVRMAKAIKAVSVQRGHDLEKGYALVAFGGAGGQHACEVADSLGIDKVVIHPLAGVLSAAGIGIAAVRAGRQQALEVPLAGNLALVKKQLARLADRARAELRQSPGLIGKAKVERRVFLRGAGGTSALAVRLGTAKAMRDEFQAAHRKAYGFAGGRGGLVVASVEAEATSGQESLAGLSPAAHGEGLGAAVKDKKAWLHVDGLWRDARVARRGDLGAGETLAGPALVLESTATTYVAPGWRAVMGADGMLSLRRAPVGKGKRRSGARTLARPTLGRLEVFHSLFSGVAEQMGHVLRNTARSVNIKERLDFSCAVFDARGNLVANAPHIPVHLGSMGAAVKEVIRANRNRMRPKDAWLVNAPHAGGTHLPDLTVVSPVFRGRHNATPSFFVCSRGHHADVGGTTPGSMPANSTSLAEEGVLFENFQLVRKGELEEAGLRELLGAGPFPARDPDQNVGDLLAQLAANAKGARELARACDEHGDAVITAFMGHIQDNAAAAVRSLLGSIRPGSHVVRADNGAQVRVSVTLGGGARYATFDFSGTSAQDAGNLNAPPAVVDAAVCYVLRCMIGEDVPLNSGFMRPVRVATPAGSMLRPRPGAAVAAGNVEVSQMVVDALLGALGVCAQSQGTMNNLTIGDARRQYYETVCGGAGAARGHDGMSAVHTHMTNTLITDAEVLEDRIPVVVDRFAIRRGSGGAGRWRGGDGVARTLRFLEPMAATILANRRKVAPQGMAGGGRGKTGANWVARADGRVEAGGSRAHWQLATGDVLELRTPGGGGWGRPDGG